MSSVATPMTEMQQNNSHKVLKLKLAIPNKSNELHANFFFKY